MRKPALKSVPFHRTSWRSPGFPGIALSIVLSLALAVGCATTPPVASPQGKTPTSLRVALVQLHSSEVGDFAAMRAYAEKARAQGAELVIFPESSVFGWLNPAVFTQSQPIPGEHASQFARIARELDIWVAAGLAERGPGIGTTPSVHGAYDSGILVNPAGEIVLHHRKYQVLRNAFDESACQELWGREGCSYTAGSLSDVRVAETPFGRVAIIVCADAYTWDTTVLDRLKTLHPEIVIVPWGVAAAQQAECGTDGFNATGFAAQAAARLESAYVVGANSRGDRPYGRFRPSVYCGNSGFANPDGTIGGVANQTDPLVFFAIPLSRTPSH